MTDELELSQEYANIRGAQAAKRLFELCLRHQGEGTYPVAQFLVGLCYITNRGEYQWRARIRRLGYPEQSKKFNTKAQAEAWARMIETEMDRGIFTPRAEAERTTLSEALDRYAREVTPKKKSSAQDLVRIKKWQASTLYPSSCGRLGKETQVTCQAGVWRQ